MAHPLGALYDTPHGVANAIILPTVMEYNASETGEKYRDIAKAMGVEGVDAMSQEEYRKAAVDAVKKLSLDVGIPADLKEIAKTTAGFTGADLENLLNEAAILAAREDRRYITNKDLYEGINKVLLGPQKKSRLVTETDKRITAYHEAGHATVSWMLPHANPLLKVTIIPRGRALGAAWYLPEERQITTTEQMMDEMAATLGGRAAEEIINGKISTGALSDLEKVTKQSYAMVMYYGMSDKVGHLSFYDSTGGNGYSFDKPYSQKTAELIDKEAKQFIDQAHKTALEVLKENMEGFTQLAELLLEREVIFSEDLEKIFGPRKPKDGEAPKETPDFEEVKQVEEPVKEDTV